MSSFVLKIPHRSIPVTVQNLFNLQLPNLQTFIHPFISQGGSRHDGRQESNETRLLTYIILFFNFLECLLITISHRTKRPTEAEVRQIFSKQNSRLPKMTQKTERTKNRVTSTTPKLKVNKRSCFCWRNTGPVSPTRIISLYLYTLFIRISFFFFFRSPFNKFC